MSYVMVPAAAGAHGFKLWFAEGTCGDPDEVYADRLPIVAYRIQVASTSVPVPEAIFHGYQPRKDDLILFSDGAGGFYDIDGYVYEDLACAKHLHLNVTLMERARTKKAAV
jgi:hypothetical protein